MTDKQIERITRKVVRRYEKQSLFFERRGKTKQLDAYNRKVLKFCMFLRKRPVDSLYFMSIKKNKSSGPLINQTGGG